MGRHSETIAVVANTVLFQAETVENLMDDVRREAAYWSELFPDGLKNKFSETVLKPNYLALKAELRSFSYETGVLLLKGKPNLAILPGSRSKEGLALAFYAKTDLAFAIVGFLWSEVDWLDESFGKDSADAIAQEIGEMLVTAVRLGSSLRAEGDIAWRG